MVNVILIHDGENHKWYDWLSTELVKRGHSFFQPVFPPVKDGVTSWIDALKDYRKHLDESSIIIGHGFGRIIALKILEEKLRGVAGAFFVSGKPLIDDLDKLSFDDFDFSHIVDKADNFFIYGSDKDTSDSLKESEILANKFEEDVLILDGPAYFKELDSFEDLLIDIISVVGA